MLDSEVLVGAGPNRWRGQHVSLDDEDIVLRLAPDPSHDPNGRGWWAAETWTTLPSGPALIQFEVDTCGLEFGERVIFGAFIYADDSREIDLELGRFGDAGAPTVHHTVVGSAHRTVRAPSEACHHSRHRIKWSRRVVRIESWLEGEHYETTVRGSSPAYGADYAFHLNLWAFEGQMGGAAAPIEVRVSNLKIAR